MITIEKRIKRKIYNKYKYKCAYCGKDKIECFENYMPTCRRCNHYKRGNSLESFRKAIQEIPTKLYRDNYIYKVGEDFGLIKSIYNAEIIFWFEVFDASTKNITS